MTPRPRRSCLTVPASSARMLEKAATLTVDEVVVDLEDGVAAVDKKAARDRLGSARAARNKACGESTSTLSYPAPFNNSRSASRTST